MRPTALRSHRSQPAVDRGTAGRQRVRASATRAARAIAARRSPRPRRPGGWTGSCVGATGVSTTGVVSGATICHVGCGTRSSRGSGAAAIGLRLRRGGDRLGLGLGRRRPAPARGGDRLGLRLRRGGDDRLRLRRGGDRLRRGGDGLRLRLCDGDGLQDDRRSQPRRRLGRWRLRFRRRRSLVLVRARSERAARTPPAVPARAPGTRRRARALRRSGRPARARATGSGTDGTKGGSAAATASGAGATASTCERSYASISSSRLSPGRNRCSRSDVLAAAAAARSSTSSTTGAMRDGGLRRSGWRRRGWGLGLGQRCRFDRGTGWSGSTRAAETTGSRLAAARRRPDGRARPERDVTGSGVTSGTASVEGPATAAAGPETAARRARNRSARRRRRGRSGHRGMAPR